MKDCTRKNLGFRIREEQEARGIPECERLGNRDQNPRPQNPPTLGSSSLASPTGEVRSGVCRATQIAEALLAILNGDAILVFPTSDLDHPSEYVHIHPAANRVRAFTNQKIRWDHWQFSYVPLICGLTRSKRWSYSRSDLQIIEGRVLDLPKSVRI